MNNKRILIIDDEQVIRETLTEMLTMEGYETLVSDNGSKALEMIEHEQVDLVLCDIRLPDIDGRDLLQKALDIKLNVFFIMMTAFGSVESAVESMKLGASDYITKPFLFDDVRMRIKRLFDYQNLANEKETLKQELHGKYSLSGMIGKCDKMQHVFRLIQKVAVVDSNVLITGKSGTGKELTARAIHLASKRSNKRFVAINCGAIPETLLESELFGYKKGAFTDAKQDKQGLFLYAHEGTIFLDEVTELPYNLQAKLLRVIEEKEVRPIGVNKAIPINVRLLAASNREVQECVDRGEFRKDLYYRINVFNIHLPELKERKEDIPQLIEHLSEKICRKLGIEKKAVSPSFVKAVISHEWPGNIRELENTLEQCIVLSSCNALTGDDLIQSDYSTQTSSAMGNFIIQELDKQGGLKETMKSCEREYILSVIENSNDIKEAMASLHLTKTTFYRKLKEHNINLKERKKNSQTWEN